MRDFFRPGRSMVSGMSCAVASSHAIASAVAMRVLDRGGNAVDAAVTATFTLCVVEPQSTGIGGDCFSLFLPAGSSTPLGFNGSGRSPRALDPRSAKADGGAPLAETSVHAVTVPGLVDGLSQLLERHGTMPLAAAVEPAIDYAEKGFVVYPRVAEEWAFVRDKLAANEGARAALLASDGETPRQGDVVRLPALAATLRAIAAGGRDAFHRGAVAHSMASFLKGMGGFHAAEDFEAHRGRFVEPVRGRYRDHDVWQIPPNGQGVTALMMLRLMEEAGAAPAEFDGAERHILLARAARAAFAERDRVIADPDFGAVPLGGFLEGAGGAASLAAAPPARGDTAYVSVVDREGNAVSLISSLFEGFGSGLCDPGTGVVFHNRGSGFSAFDDHPNALAPAKRPLHTIIPGMVTCGGRPVLSFGVTGGPFQPIGQAQIISAMVDYGLDIQDAIDRPRSFLLRDVVQLEPDLLRHGPALELAGFAVEPATRAVGGAHGIAFDAARGTLSAGSDPRKDGCALAL